jgi:hypothetical protein
MAPMIMFVIGALSIWFVAALGKFVAQNLVSHEVAHVAGFAFACGVGFAGGFRGISPSSEAEFVTLSSGIFAGLVLVWYLFFKRVKANG